jgi:S1-C subfamily serine protease
MTQEGNRFSLDQAYPGVSERVSTQIRLAKDDSIFEMGKSITPYVWIGLFCFICLFGGNGHAQGSNELNIMHLDAFRDSISRSVVMVLGRTEDMYRQTTTTSIGNGFCVQKKGWIVTSLHIVASVDSIAVMTWEGSSCWVRTPLRKDSEHDLALVAFKNNGATMPPPVHIGADHLSVGEEVVAISRPPQGCISISTGCVTGVNIPFVWGNGSHGEGIEFTAPIYHGYSGSPVANMSGEIVGLATGIDTATGLSYAWPAALIDSLVTSATRQE